MSCSGRRAAAPTASHEIIGQLNCANVGPLNCMVGGAGSPMDCSQGVGGGGGGGGGGGISEYRSSSVSGIGSRSRNSGNTYDSVCSGGGEDGSLYAENAQRVLDTLNRLWQEDKMCDVTIMAQCDQLKAHKIALAAHSEFLLEKFCKFPAGLLHGAYNNMYMYVKNYRVENLN